MKNKNTKEKTLMSEFIGGFKVEVNVVRRICDGIKNLYEFEKFGQNMQSKTDIDLQRVLDNWRNKVFAYHGANNFKKAIEILDAISLADGKHVYLRYEEASWLGAMKRVLEA